ncbi:MAG: cytochrome-c peroxidase [Candidatus Manganitrophus sp.]|nr:MAG: cytochrome-c peroxidase [Candidatus Manganitrophus sp.]
MKKRRYHWITFGLIIFFVFFLGWEAPLQARPKKTDKYPPETLFDTLPNPPFHLHPLLAPPIPPYNLQTPAKVALGKMLFFDPRLSRDNTVSCATCHNPEHGFSDARPVSIGIDGQKGTRNAPTIFNVAYNKTHFWDGRAGSLEEQALGPIQNPIEMGEDLNRLVQKLNAVPGYVEAFKKAFGTEVTADGIAQAIAAFERTILSNNSPFDRFMAGDDNALTPTEQHGIRVFNEKGKCVTCHNGPNFTDNKFHALGLPKREGIPNDIGRYAITQDEAEKEQFKTPTLRNIAQTAPYMHNGMFATLEEVVEFYVRAERTTSPRHPLITPLTLLTDHDKKALIEFLKSLTGEPVKMTPPKLPE